MDSLSSDVRGRGNVCLETVKNSPNDMTAHTMEETRIGHHVNSSEYHNELDDFLVSDKLKIQNEALTFPVEQKMEDTKADTMLSEISMSPITTETDIDITSALLPSGGTQSHHHAMRMAVLETGQVQSSYNFPQQTKDIGIFQCQPFTLPKNQSNRSDKSRSTFPFSMGTQSLPLSRKKKQPEPFLLESQNDKIFMAAMEIKIEKHNWKGGPLVNEADFIQELASEILIKGQNPTYSQNNDYINMQSTDFVGSKLKNTTELNVLHNSTVDMDSLPSDSIAAHNIECQEPKQAISFQVEESPGVPYTDIVTQNLHDIPKHCIIVQHNEYNDPAQNNNLLHHQHKCEKINRSEVVESGNIRDTGLGISSVMLDLHGAGQEQSDSINIVENTCWPEKDLDSEHPTDIDEPRKDEPMSLFKDTGQHDPACCSMENSENLNSVRDEAEMSLAEQVNNPSLKYDNHRQSKHQTVKEELPGKETTVLDDPKVEFTDNQEESIIHSDDTDTRREIIPWRAEALITDSGPFNESPTKSMAKTDEPSEICNIIPENVIKISVQDVFGDLMKENGQSFLEELRRIYLDAEGQGYTLFDSGIALTSKTNQVEDNITYVTLRNGLQLGMTIPFSQLFLYYQLGLHIIITGQLNDDWYHAADRITQEHFLIKKVPVNCNWVKILHNFLSIPHHPSLLVPYAVMYDRNGFIHFLMEDRNVIAVGKPPKGFCFNKQKHMWETLNFLKFCKQNHLCPRDIEDAVLYTEKGICFDPSCLCSIEDLCIFKKSISRTLENLLCNESQEELSLETEALIERTYQCMEEDAELPSELWQTSFTSSNVAGPIPFSFPCFPNEK